jgi:hypothetical protein
MRAVFGLVLAGLLGACGATAIDQCSGDGDCPPGSRCEDSRCVCVTDEACDEGFECNSAGACQRRPGCETNADCEGETFCDLGTGQCLSGQPLTLASSCNLASHCPPGSTCEDGVCVEGCRDTGDCVLGEVCVDGACSDGFGVCEDDSFCRFGQRCIEGACEDDLRGPYCRGCSVRTDMNPDPCSGFRNFCLINNRELGGATNICGVSCATGEPCPNGYFCSDVVVLTQDQCSTDAQCQCLPGNILPRDRRCTLPEPCQPTLPDGSPDPNATGCVVEGFAQCNGGTTGGGAACVAVVGATEGFCTCADDSQCPGDATCVGGDCCAGPVDDSRQCVSGEGQLQGRCTCNTDDDCGRDTCRAASATCAISGIPCTPGAGDCPPIPCVDGGCEIGQNCAPEPGLTCSELTAP